MTVTRGPDEKPFTADDVDLWMVPATFSLREAIVRDDDDDLSYVGTLDGATGEFTPAIDGPNVQRKWSANNIGEVYVECTVALDVPVRPEPPPKSTAAPKPDVPEKPAESADPQPSGQSGGDGAQEPNPKPASVAAKPEPAGIPVPMPAPRDGDELKPTGGTPLMERKSFRARASLIVTVPQYIRWTRLEWEER